VFSGPVCLGDRPIKIERLGSGAAAVEPLKRQRAKLTNSPLSVRASRNTALGRLVPRLCDALGNPVDTVTLSDVLAAAESKPQLLHRSRLSQSFRAVKEFNDLVASVETDLGGRDQLSAIERALVEAFASSTNVLNNLRAR